MFEDARWPATSGLIDRFCGSKGNFLVFGDGPEGAKLDLLFARFCLRGERRADLERQYFEFYHPHDERVPRLRQLRDGRVVHVSSLYSVEERRTSVVYNEALPRSRTRDSLNVRLDGPHGSRISWAIGDPIDRVGWSAARVEALERLLPHLRQFVWVRQALVNAKALGSTVIDLLDNVRMGVVQLNRHGRMVQANERALAVLRKRDGLSDEDGRLVAARPAENDELQRLVARALQAPGGAGGSLLVGRTEAGPRLMVHVSPVAEGGPAPRRSRVGALVLLVDPAGRGRIDPMRVGELFGLTPAESRVAAMLAEGRTTREIAAMTGRSRNTVRWHLGPIFSKLGVSRQADVVRAVSALANTPGVPH